MINKNPSKNSIFSLRVPERVAGSKNIYMCLCLFFYICLTYHWILQPFFFSVPTCPQGRISHRAISSFLSSCDISVAGHSQIEFNNPSLVIGFFLTLLTTHQTISLLLPVIWRFPLTLFNPLLKQPIWHLIDIPSLRYIYLGKPCKERSLALKTCTWQSCTPYFNSSQ